MGVKGTMWLNYIEVITQGEWPNRLPRGIGSEPSIVNTMRKGGEIIDLYEEEDMMSHGRGRREVMG